MRAELFCKAEMTAGVDTDWIHLARAIELAEQGRGRVTEAAVSQACLVGAAWGPVEVADEARRQSGDARRCLKVDLGGDQPRASPPVARGVRRRGGRDRHRAG